MEQTRTLPYDYGIGDGTMYASSSVTNEAAEPQCRSEKFLMDMFTMGKSAAVTPISASLFEGYQNFGSTEHKRPMFNGCSNMKLRGFCYPYGITYENYRVPASIYLTPYSALNPSSYYTYRQFVESASAYDVFWSATDNAQRRAWRSMQPRFNGRVELLNFIFELKDFKDVSKSVLKFRYRNLADELKSIRRLLRESRRELGIDPDQITLGMIPQVLKSLDYTSRGLASVFLTKKLAVDPFIRDIFAIHVNMAQQASEAESAFKQQGTKTNRSHYGEVIFDESTSDPYYSRYNYYWRQLTKRQTLRFTATMEYSYEYKTRPAMQAFRRYWGLDLTSEVIWNALPYTFIADYFISIGESIGNMTSDPNVALTMSQYCESTLYEAFAGFETKGDPRTQWICVNGVMNSGDKTGIPISGWEYSSFQRRVGEPDKALALPQLRWPSFGQSAILASLIRCWI